MAFLLARARGEVPTGAKFIRDFINQAPSYKHNSKLTPCTINMLVQQIIDINRAGEKVDEQLVDCFNELNISEEQDPIIDAKKSAPNNLNAIKN